MTSIEAYKHFLLKINKNDTNANIRIEPSEFVMLYNQQARQWLVEKVEKYKSNQLLYSIDDLISLPTKLAVKETNDTYNVYYLPENYYYYLSSESRANRTGCEKNLTNYIIKAQNKGILLNDAFTKPSFEWEETLVEIVNKSLLVYKSDFEIKETYLNYISYPIDIDIEGYEKLSGEKSTNVNPDLPNEYVEQIINRTAMEAVGNYENANAYQFKAASIQKEI